MSGAGINKRAAPAPQNLLHYSRLFKHFLQVLVTLGTCGGLLAVELVPDDEDGCEEEEDTTQHLHPRVGEQRVLHGRVLHLQHEVSVSADFVL